MAKPLGQVVDLAERNMLREPVEVMCIALTIPEGVSTLVTDKRLPPPQIGNHQLVWLLVTDEGKPPTFDPPLNTPRFKR
jgi:hypothetical protein